MWIRIQNKDMLVEVVQLYIRSNPTYPKVDYCISGISEVGTTVELAAYPNKKEAQFVLDKIYDQLKLHPTDLVYTLPSVEEIQKMMIRKN